MHLLPEAQMLHDKRIDGLVKRVSHVLQDKRDREKTESEDIYGSKLTHMGNN